MQKNASTLNSVFSNLKKPKPVEEEPLLETSVSETTVSGKPVFAKGYNFYKLFWIFFLGSFLGDIIETIFCFFTTHTVMSRSSVIYGPFSVVWGIGAVVLTVGLHKLSNKRDLYIFLNGTLLGGIYEYICSWITEVVFGASFWDYSDIPFNIQGRVNLLFCFFWGLVALVWVKDIYPRLSGLIERIPCKLGKPLSWVLLLFMIVNMFLSATAIIRAVERQYEIKAESSFEQFLDKSYPDKRIQKVYPNMKFVK